MTYRTIMAMNPAMVLPKTKMMSPQELHSFLVQGNGRTAVQIGPSEYRITEPEETHEPSK